jgi:hypothetical protein
VSAFFSFGSFHHKVHCPSTKLPENNTKATANQKVSYRMLIPHLSPTKSSPFKKPLLFDPSDHAETAITEQA